MRGPSTVVATLLVVLLATLGSAAAQEATPATWYQLGYAEMTITATDTGFVVPGPVLAGRYLVTFENTGTQGNGMFFWRLPEGVTVADLQAGLTPREPGSTGAAPDAFYQADLPGAPGYAEAGQRTQAIIDLAPGSYAVLTEEGAWATPLEVLPLSLLGATPIAFPGPDTDLEIALQEFAFDTVPPQLPAGRHVWKITNDGQQPHQVIVGRVPDGMTFAQVLAGFPHALDATPAQGAMRRSDFSAVGGLEIISPGHTAWALLDLTPGTYAVVCLVPDRATGFLHASNGMISVFTVGG
jgi:hypothetical protein